MAAEDLPGWMAEVGSWLPLTHGIEAARHLAADGARSARSPGWCGRELAIGAAYTVVGLAVLAYFERESRRTASLERT